MREAYCTERFHKLYEHHPMAQSTYYIHSMTYGMNMENPHNKLTRETKKNMMKNQFLQCKSFKTINTIDKTQQYIRVADC